ncbi:hypothetical protein B0T14DRAFT_531262 [Immersiella caudata]|uniref:2EXR domain-containing protein n=1 Tax=Immersiella caudata TaxID=314043 RepID=A0AA39U6D9_9PEZI|nr:hypothetical protein B0T14DRAFT_531262 [Immersiella caudata]
MSSPPGDEEAVGIVVFDDSDEDDASAAKNGSDSGAASEYDSDDEHENSHLFDLEASEEEDDSEQHEDYEDEDEGSEDDDDDEIRFFPQFMRFPIELRLKVWEHFCAELTADGRVFEHPCHGNTFLLANQTASSRAVLSTHRESREFALKALPDLLVMPILSFEDRFVDEPATIRFNKEKDIVLLSRYYTFENPRFAEFFAGVRNLAVDLDWCRSQDIIPHPMSILQRSSSSMLFTQLKNMFFTVHPSDCSPSLLRWCGSNKARLSPITSFRERIEGLSLDHREMYCWPDFENHRSFAEQEIPLDKLWKELGLPEYPGTDSDSPVEQQLKKLPIWPLVLFRDDWIESLEDLQSGLRVWDSDSGSSNHDESESSGYESSGIDDEEIAEGTEDDEDEDDLVVVGREQDREEGDEDTTEFGGFSPLQRPNDIIGLTENGKVPVAQFSSPEQESATVDGGSDDSDSDEPAARRTRIEHSRKRVLDESEDEEDSEDEAPTRQARKRARYVHRVEDTDEENNSSNQGAEPPGKGRDEVSDEESSEEEEEEVPRTMSLAERLQLHRHQNPVPDEQDSESNADEMDEDDYGNRHYADFDDDEDGEYPEDGQEELVIDLNEDDEEEEY